MAPAAKPTNEQIVQLLDRILEELDAIRRAQTALAAQVDGIRGSEG